MKITIIERCNNHHHGPNQNMSARILSFVKEKAIPNQN